jgi:hypothetical protein
MDSDHSKTAHFTDHPAGGRDIVGGAGLGHLAGAVDPFVAVAVIGVLHLNAEPTHVGGFSSDAVLTADQVVPDDADVDRGHAVALQGRTDLGRAAGWSGASRTQGGHGLDRPLPSLRRAVLPDTR